MNTPQPTFERLTLGMSNREYTRWTDGSLRRSIPKPNGKAVVKRIKRQRQHTNKVFAQPVF